MRSPPTLPRRRGSLQPDHSPKNRLSDSSSAVRKLAAAPLHRPQVKRFSKDRGNHLPHSVSCLSSIENTAPFFTSTFLTMQTRPMLSASFTSYRPRSIPVILRPSSCSPVPPRSFLHWS